MTKRPGNSGWQNKNNYLVRLRRVEGQIRGLQRMVEDDKASFVLSHLGSVPDGAREEGPHPREPGQDCPGRRPLRSEG